MQRFEATTDCPKCAHLDTHWLEEPRHATVGEWLAYLRAPGRTVEVVGFGGTTVRRYGPLPPGDDEFEVMRRCTACNHKWGQVPTPSPTRLEAEETSDWLGIDPDLPFFHMGAIVET